MISGLPCMPGGPPGASTPVARTPGERGSGGRLYRLGRRDRDEERPDRTSAATTARACAAPVTDVVDGGRPAGDRFPDVAVGDDLAVADDHVTALLAPWERVLIPGAPRPCAAPATMPLMRR